MTISAKPPVPFKGGPGGSSAKVDSRVPQLEKDLEEARLKWTDLAKEHAALTFEVKKVPKLEVEVDELKHTISKVRSVY